MHCHPREEEHEGGVENLETVYRTFVITYAIMLEPIRHCTGNGIVVSRLLVPSARWIEPADIRAGLATHFLLDFDHATLNVHTWCSTLPTYKWLLLVVQFKYFSRVVAYICGDESTANVVQYVVDQWCFCSFVGNLTLKTVGPVNEAAGLVRCNVQREKNLQVWNGSDVKGRGSFLYAVCRSRKHAFSTGERPFRLHHYN